MTRPARPAELTVHLNCSLPRWTCYVTDGKGTANGGYWKGFRSHAEMDAWLAKHGYVSRDDAMHALAHGRHVEQ
jgi:hypothetical protein